MTETVLEKENTVTSEDDLRQYLHEIRVFPLLTAQEELELAKGCAAGDAEAIRTMVNSNLRLVVAIAREYTGRGVPLPDLIQEGSIGLLIAAQKFDYTLQYRFSTYATKWIRQCITRYILNHAGVIRVPRQTMERMRKLLAIRSAMSQESGAEPTIEELAQQSGETVEKVRQLLELLPDICSLDAPTGENEDGTLQMLLEDVHAPQPQEALVRRELKKLLDNLMQTLTQRQQQVLRLRFGMEDGNCYSLEKVGNLLNISRERARQIERQALSKLHKSGAPLGLEDFLE